MKPKEIKDVLSNEAMKTVVQKQIDAAVKNETKRCLEAAKRAVAIEYGENHPKMSKSVINKITLEIKAPF